MCTGIVNCFVPGCVGLCSLCMSVLCRLLCEELVLSWPARDLGELPRSTSELNSSVFSVGCTCEYILASKVSSRKYGISYNYTAACLRNACSA